LKSKKFPVYTVEIRIGINFWGDVDFGDKEIGNIEMPPRDVPS